MVMTCKKLTTLSLNQKVARIRYNNLQVLHRHCHDDKTVRDASLNGTHDKEVIGEEPWTVETLMHGSEDELSS
jgi:5-methylcytosine-specific restriction endonuclease McrA